MKKLAIIILMFIVGCNTKPQVGPPPADFNRENMPKAKNFAYIGPQSEFELIPGLKIKLISTETPTSMPNPDVTSPYTDLHFPKGKILILTVQAWKTKDIISDTLPPMECISVVASVSTPLLGEGLLRNIETYKNLSRLDTKKVTTQPQDFILCFPVEGGGYGWTIYVYGIENGKHVLLKIIDTGV